MKKLWILASFILVIIIGIAFFSIYSQNQSGTKEIEIGAILPLTGDAALYGQNAKEGIDLAAEKINTSGGVLGKRIKIIYEDTQGDPKMAVLAFQKLVEINKVPAVIGDITSSAVLAVAPIANKEKVVVLSPAATSPKISEAGDFIFRNWTSDAYEAQVMASYASKDLSLKKVSLLLVNNDYGIGLEEAFNKDFSSFGGKVGLAETFTAGDTDFRSQISKLKDDQSDAIYLISYPAETVIILKQMKEMGLKTTLLSTSAFQDQQIIKQSGDSAEGVIFPYPSVPDQNDPTVKTFMNDFEKKYSKKPGIVCDTGYDALNMIVSAINQEKSYSGVAIQKGLSQLRDFHGASGLMSFDKNGDVEKTMEMKTVKNGNFVTIQ